MPKLLITATLLLLLSLKPLFAQVEDGVDIREVQRVLTTLCYKPGPIDGLWGRRTANAVTEFFADEEKVMTKVSAIPSAHKRRGKPPSVNLS